jgi:hypothetical protein
MPSISGTLRVHNLLCACMHRWIDACMHACTLTGFVILRIMHVYATETYKDEAKTLQAELDRLRKDVMAVKVGIIINL